MEDDHREIQKAWLEQHRPWEGLADAHDIQRPQERKGMVKQEGGAPRGPKVEIKPPALLSPGGGEQQTHRNNQRPKQEDPAQGVLNQQL